MTDESAALYESVREDLERGDAAAAAGRLEKTVPAEIADLVRSLEREDRISLLRHLPAERAAAVLAEVDDRSLADLLDLLRDGEIVEMLDTLPSDDAADVVGQLDSEDQERVIDLLERVDHEDAVELKELLRYPEDSAGGLMAKEYLALRADARVGSVRETLKALDDEELSQLHYGFVIDGAGRLIGRVGLLKLLLTDAELRVAEIMEPDPLAVEVDEDQEEVAHLFLDHDLLSLPVIDSAGRLVGRVTVDDAMDVLTEEATEDVARMAGSSADEVGETSVWRIGRLRMPWLLLGLAGETLSALVISGFEESLQARVTLAFFIPMVMATGGNTGFQASSIMIRTLVTGDFDRHRAWRHLLRELSVSLLIGAMLGAIVATGLFLWKGEPDLGGVVGLSMMAVVSMAAIVGTTVPLLCARLKIDPTVATGPFITTTNDVVGLLVYLGIAHVLLGAI